MKGKVLKERLKNKFDSLLDNISDDFDYNFVTECSCFDGCSDTYYTKQSTSFEIECAIARFLKNCTISDKITIQEV